MKAEESSTFWPIPLALGPMVERFAGAGLVIVLVVFMLIQREDLRNRLIRLVGYGRLTFTTRALEEAGQRDKPLFTHADDHQFLLRVGGGFSSLSDRPFPMPCFGAFSRPRCVLFPMSDPLRLQSCRVPLAWRFSKVGCGRSWLWEFLSLCNSFVIWFWSLCSMRRARVFRRLDF